MATIIVRTNPDRARDGRFKCSICKTAVFDTFDEARPHAEADYTRRTGRDAAERRAA